MVGENQQGLRVLLGVWYLAGLVLLLALLTKGNVDALAARTGGSVLATIFFGFVVAAGAQLAEEEGVRGLIGAATLLVALSTFVLLAVEIWAKHPLQHYDRTFTMVALSVLLGAVSLLLGSARGEDGPSTRAARGVAIAALAVLGILVVVSAAGGNPGARLSGIVAAFFLIPALSLPALRLLDE
jgi:hypothetical protein